MASKKPQKKKNKAKEPDLFTAADTKGKRKPKEWKYPRGVKYDDVEPGDILVFQKSRNWNRGGEVEEYRGEVLEKGIYDTNARYFVVKMQHPELGIMDARDIRRFILKKK